MRKKVKIKKSWREQHCKSCIWLINGSLCPFSRCIKVKGWVADKTRQKAKKGVGTKGNEEDR